MVRDDDSRETGSLRPAGVTKGSEQVVVAMDEGGPTLKAAAHALEQVRALARPYAPKDRLASEALIAERRSES